MKVTSVSYSRKFNLGNYEMEEIGLVLELEEGEKFGDAMLMARKAVLSQATKREKPQSVGATELEKMLQSA